MPGQFTALMICPNTFKQFRQPLQRQGRIVPSDRRWVTPPRFAAGFVSINS